MMVCRPDRESDVIVGRLTGGEAACAVMLPYPAPDVNLPASSLNYQPGQRAIANELVTKLSPTGTICLYSSATTHLIVDIDGYTTTKGQIREVIIEGGDGSGR